MEKPVSPAARGPAAPTRPVVPEVPPLFGPERIPPGIRRILSALPERDWYRLRTFVVESGEEGQLADLLPRVKRAMSICPPRMISRIRGREITGEAVDQVYSRLHEAIHGVRQAVLAVFDLAGVAPDRSRPAWPKKSSKPALAAVPPAAVPPASPELPDLAVPAPVADPEPEEEAAFEES